jgi:hypothetical protein
MDSVLDRFRVVVLELVRLGLVERLSFDLVLLGICHCSQFSVDIGLIWFCSVIFHFSMRLGRMSGTCGFRVHIYLRSTSGTSGWIVH